MNLAVIGRGKAGGSFVHALTSVGVAATAVPGRDTDFASFDTRGFEAILICTPDAAVAAVAGQLLESPAVLLHASGALGIDALGRSHRVGSLHPLMVLPNATTGSLRLRDHGWFAVAGDADAGRAMATTLVQRLGGRSFTVADGDRACYHAAAAIAANHVTALMGQVERLAARVGVPMDAFIDLAHGALQSVAEVGAAAALTGPAARNDIATLASHRASIGDEERGLYDVLSLEASRLGSSAGTSTKLESEPKEAP